MDLDLTEGTLSRLVPAHMHTVKFRWVKRKWMLFGDFKRARTNMRLGVYTKCFWCKKEFTESDMMALASPEKAANRLLCQTCVEQIQPDSIGDGKHG